ncbi:hypothetical protein TI39_contig424g00003 [Zymoseptoria brevis]|uniref:Uncharacterized protein n=1 Tax=Zymoseptoria brevis TaxID=1047168 RepID=A0A0F4GPW8_9PEZI|nr:hypothetical protein TI39_contig424g00003 [Zymoseptoria brevis]
MALNHIIPPNCREVERLRGEYRSVAGGASPASLPQDIELVIEEHRRLLVRLHRRWSSPADGEAGSAIAARTLMQGLPEALIAGAAKVAAFYESSSSETTAPDYDAALVRMMAELHNQLGLLGQGDPAARSQRIRELGDEMEEVIEKSGMIPRIREELELRNKLEKLKYYTAQLKDLIDCEDILRDERLYREVWHDTSHA